MSTLFDFSKIRRLRTKKDTSPALVLKITERVIDNMLHYAIQITKQRYWGGKFNYGTDSFIASNSFILASASCPAGSSANSDNGSTRYLMYLRGSSQSSDNTVVTIRSLGWVEKLKVAVKEYNEHMEK